ncbi:hypothetical protein PG985_005708 [Apiospora marii]|uniref:uncharacterized protein n=1 Tax=Apiospora marii TaxID=335849 RepID=UPI003130EBCA
MRRYSEESLLAGLGRPASGYISKLARVLVAYVDDAATLGEPNRLLLVEREPPEPRRVLAQRSPHRLHKLRIPLGPRRHLQGVRAKKYI